MLEVLNLLTCLWLGGWVVLAVRQLSRGHRDSVLFVLLVHVFFAGLPLLLDLTLGKPDYGRFLGFALASQDTATGIIYCAYVSLVPLVLWRFGRPRRRHRRAIAAHESQNRNVRRVRPLLYLILVSPALALLFAPSPAIYQHYAQTTRDALSGSDAMDYHAIVALLSVLSVLGAAGAVLTARGRLSAAALPVLPFLGLSVWLHGKRFIIALTFVMLGYVLWNRGYLRGGRTVLAGLGLAMLVAVSSVAYQASFRGLNVASSGWESVYLVSRIDFGRDDVIKLAIYAELYPEQVRILEHRGQSVLFYLTMLVPREVWPDKPLPYAQYMTSALFLASPRLWGWGMTTSWLDEAIANFGWFGLLAGPLVIALVCRTGDRSAGSFARLLTVVTASLLLAVQWVAFAPVALLWVVAVRFGRKDRSMGRALQRSAVAPRQAALVGGE